MKLNSSLLGLRALQATRRLHLPSYVATRFLLDSIAGRADSSWATLVPPRKYPTQGIARYRKFHKFKKVLVGGEIEYREFCVPSPTTAIAEALVLANLATVPALQKLRNIYSYLWPKRDDCPYNFEHYINGYKARNRAIQEYIETNKHVVLIVSDIERFYPSILRNRVRVRFNTILRESSLDFKIQSTASGMLEHLFECVPGDRGVATGPELSHVIGDIALQRIDRILSERFGKAYFRYVDDIVLAVPPDSKEDAIRLLRELTEQEALTINQDKTDIVLASEWISDGPHHAHHVEETSFESLVFFLKVYLLRNPESEDALSVKLRDAGFSIPLKRIGWAGREASFFSRVNRLRRRGWWVVIKALTSRESDIISKAFEVRHQVYELLKRLLDVQPPNGVTRKRWFIQRLRYLTNRALYLLPPSDLRFLIEPLRTFPEFAETVALLEMLVNENVDHALKMPGAALLAGAGMLKESGRRLNGVLDINDYRNATVDSLSVLLLFDVVRIDQTVIEAFNADDAELLKFCAGQSPKARIRSDFSYIDEIRSLQLFRNQQDNLTMIESRFSDQEGVVLDALDIGGEYSY